MTRFIFISFIFWRISLFFISWFGQKVLRFYPSFPYSDIYLTQTGLPDWFWSFANFDGVHYLTIMKQGYSAQFTQVFFPLYPIIIRFLSEIFYWINPILTGLIISNAFFILSIFVFRSLMILDYKVELVKWSILFLLFFPTTFFFGSLYTESLFILLVFMAFYMARKKKWWIAGILGGLASATRFAGIFLLPALLWEWYETKFKTQNSKLKANKILPFALCTLHSPILYLVPLGLISYMLYLQFAFGDWLYFWHVQPVFGAERSGQALIFIPQVIFRYIKILFAVSFFSYAFWIGLFELLFTLVTFFLLFFAHKKNIRTSYLIFSWLAVIVPTLTGTFSSMPRYILVAFPIYFILGMIRNEYFKSLILIINFILMIILTALFSSGRWVA